MVVIVFGLPGSGKSFFASRLANLINAIYISSDKVRMEMYQQKTYSENEKLAVYDEMLRRMKEIIRESGKVVLDATFYKDEIRSKFIDVTQGDIDFIEVVADVRIIQERLKKPRPDSDADFEVYQKIKSVWEKLNDDHLALQSTNDNIDEILHTAISYLNVRNDNRRN